MKPKDKAEDLIRKYCLTDCTDENIGKAKQYAIIAVDEILEEHNNLVFIFLSESKKQTSYWKKVKKEILSY